MYYFISDLHLGFFEREKDKLREDLFLNLLDKISIDAEEIFLLGDIFDFWFDYKTVIPKYFYRTLTKLYELKSKGIKITYIIGNHDFGHFNFFKDELGIIPITEDLERVINGKKFYLSHGDGKTNKDLGYLILKSILRNPISNKIYRFLHPDFGIGLASTSSKKSRNYTDKKNYGNTDGIRDFAIKKLSEGYDFVIMGHRHKVFDEVHYNGRYINLGAWFDKPIFAVFDKSELLLKNVLENC